MEKNISFKSNIRVVSPSHFKHISENIFAQKEELISAYDILPKYNGADLLGYRTQMTDGFTRKVRSCSAGIVANKGYKAPIFMLLFNSKENNKTLVKLTKYFNGSNAILVGSKKSCQYSSEIFSKLKKYLKQSKIPLTYMEDLAPTYEANLVYLSGKDTFYLCVNDANNPKKYVKTMKDLKNSFKKVHISSNDNIEFSNPIKDFIYKIIK